MTRRLYLHVGSPKSGTTYLQRVLEVNRGLLADAGVLVVGGSQVDRIHAAMVVRDDPRLERLPARRRQAWQRLVDQVRSWPGESAVLSYELFSAASRPQAEKALADLAAIEGLEVHVVVTSRDLGLAVPSAWQERLKFGLRKRLEAWTPPPESHQRSEWGWRTMDPAGVARRWGSTLPPAQVHVVTVPRAGGDPAELWHRFAEACALDDLAVELSVGRSNESLGVVESELLRRVNGRLPEPLRSDNREQAVWLRDTLAHGILAGLGDEQIGTPPAQLEQAGEVADRAREQIRAAGWAVHGDLDDLVASSRGTRLPGDVADAELLDVSVEVIAALLAQLRERAVSGTADHPADDDASGVRRTAGTLARRAVGARVQRRDAALRQRITALEAEVAAGRELHLRVAALQDVVTELVLPRHRGGQVTGRALRRYRRDAL
ncbi:DUF6752 domain-containing protein [Nocardioides rubriscoriae]|uniref:DUF6752 domain-containing protein n=1 Tax=Nocardioides rubriscoriae TaxID=642762 RepID=UPI0011DF6FB6|nr:DUF6752 domain-containing protein [Nocardioides rubriscoriae]